jgi:hypothetical protein
VNQDETAVKDPRSKNTTQDESIGLQNSVTQLAKSEQDIWDELVDESQLTSTLQTFYNSFTLTRPCCSSISAHPILQPDGLLCIECGLSAEHYCAKFSGPIGYGWDTLNWERLRNGYIHVSDYFGNTPLHYLASSPTVTVSKIL